MVKKTTTLPAVRNARLGIRLHKDLRSALEQLAEQDGRSISQYVERALAEHVRQKGGSAKQKRCT